VNEPRGFGVELTSQSHAALEYFLDKHGVRRTIGNAATVQVRGEVPAQKWTSAEAFVLSLAAEHPISVAELRARAAGLPFDVEEAIFSLTDQRILALTDEQDSKRRDFTKKSIERPPTRLDFAGGDVERVVELATQFVTRGNFLAAHEVLQRAAAVANVPGPFLDELGRLRRAFASPRQGPGRLMSASFDMQPETSASEDTRGRLQRILGTDPLDD
jgi:hypothetical protein